MDLVQHLVDHHVDSLTALIAAASGLRRRRPRRARSSSRSRASTTTRRCASVLNAMVTQEEHWLSALRGGGWPDESDQTVAGLAARHEAAGRDYREMVARAIADEAMADTFVDTTCEPPTTHTLGGTIGHVITFAAVRRTLAVGALWKAGVKDFDAADPRPPGRVDGGQRPPRQPGAGRWDAAGRARSTIDKPDRGARSVGDDHDDRPRS